MSLHEAPSRRNSNRTLLSAEEFDTSCSSIRHEEAVQMSTALQEAGITCVLWNHILLTAYGIPTVIDDVAFVIADDDVDRALEVLQTFDRIECSEDGSCRIMTHRMTSRHPAAHVHIKGLQNAITLHKQSRTLWSLPSFSQPYSKPLLHDNGDIIYARDLMTPTSRRAPVDPWDSWLTTPLGDLCLPSPHRFAEAHMRLLVRDKDDSTWAYWQAALNCMHEYVLPHGVVDYERLEAPFRRYLEDLVESDKGMGLLLGELEEGMRAMVDENSGDAEEMGTGEDAGIDGGGCMVNGSIVEAEHSGAVEDEPLGKKSLLEYERRIEAQGPSER